jgi:hypothetical protein
MVPDPYYTPGYRRQNKENCQVKSNTFEDRRFGVVSCLRGGSRQGGLFSDIQTLALLQSMMRLSLVRARCPIRFFAMHRWGSLTPLSCEFPGPKNRLTQYAWVVALFHVIFPDGLCRVNVCDTVGAIGTLYP